MQRLPCYTEAELRSPDGPNLPGLWTTAQLDLADPYAFFANSDWQPVLNLAIVTEDIDESRTTTYRMLTGSRPDTEQTHPNVVSTPTQWITDRDLLKAVMRDHFYRGVYDQKTSRGLPVTPTIHLQDINPNHFAVIGNVNPRRNRLGRIVSPLGRLTQKMLAEKLGFEDWYGTPNRAQLEQAGHVPSIGTVSMSRLLAGFSYVGEDSHDEPVYEPIVMLGAVLHTPYPKLFPRTTARYNNLSFTNMTSFKGNVRERNVGNLIKLDSEFDEVMMCVRGLCLSTGAEMSSGPDLIDHADGFPIGEAFDPHKAAVFARLLAERDERGERLVERTSAILGRPLFSRERIAFERAHFPDDTENALPDAKALTNASKP